MSCTFQHHIQYKRQCDKIAHLHRDYNPKKTEKVQPLIKCRAVIKRQGQGFPMAIMNVAPNY